MNFVKITVSAIFKPIHAGMPECAGLCRILPNMEPGIRTFLQRLVATIGLVLLWMTVNILPGIRLNYAFPEDKITIGNIVFYIWFVASGIAVARWLIRLWKQPIDFE